MGAFLRHLVWHFADDIHSRSGAEPFSAPDIEHRAGHKDSECRSPGDNRGLPPFHLVPATVPFPSHAHAIPFERNSHRPVMGWKVIVLVEIFGLSSGVGYRLNTEYSAMNVAGVLAWTIGFAGVMALLEYGVIGGIERYVTRWRWVATV